MYNTVYGKAQGKEVHKETTKAYFELWAPQKLEMDLFTYGYNRILILIIFLKDKHTHTRTEQNNHIQMHKESI